MKGNVYVNVVIGSNCSECFGFVWVGFWCLCGNCFIGECFVVVWNDEIYIGDKDVVEFFVLRVGF